MTLTDLLADFYRRTGFPSSPDSTVSTRATSFLNEVQQEILSEPGMGALLNGSLTFPSVASTPQYALPQGAGKIKSLYETTNDTRLWPRSLDWYRTQYPDPTALTGTPTDVVDLGLTSISVQPSDASQIYVDSTGADTPTAYLEGYTTGGYFRSVSVVMTTTTAIKITSAVTDFVFLTKFYLSAAAVGVVTLTEDAEGGTVLATIPIGQTMARYRRIALAPTPASAITYTVDFELLVPDMSIAKDEPVLPPQFHRLLGIGARIKEFEKQDDAKRRLIAEAEYKDGVRKLKFWLYSQAAGTPNLRGTHRTRNSQLGGSYPAGS